MVIVFMMYSLRILAKEVFTTGVFEGDLQVKATTGMGVSVGSGYCNVDGKVKFGIHD